MPDAGTSGPMVLVREACAEDAGQLAQVHVRAWQVGYRGLLADEYLDRLRAEDRAERYTLGSADPDAPQTIVAVDGTTICGFATTGLSHAADSSGSGELYALYVDPPRWGAGVGRTLLSEARRRLAARGCTRAVLWVLAGNERAERVYRADGWSHDGCRRRERVWGVEVEELRYRRTLG